jgi:NADH-quinone oxidoreductase subunit G
MRRIRNAVTLVVDGREVTAPEGTMLVDAAKMGDVEIPVFCYEPKLGDPVGACRMCLVEIEGIPKLQTACSTAVRDGMVVYTQTDRVTEAQNAVVEFLLVNHPLDCPVCDKGGECPLQDIAMGWGPGRSRVSDPKRHFQKPVELSPLIAIDRERCILCYRCVRFSQEVAEDEQLQLLERGDRSYVGTYDDRPYVAPFHGNITELCPVGALTSYTYRFRARPWEIEDAGSICTLCPSQCNVMFTVRDEKVMRVLARDNADVDDGWLCDKGRFGFQAIGSEERITAPTIRQGGVARRATWAEALAKIAEGLAPRSGRVAAIVGGQTSNEEGWLVQRMVRGALGSPHVDSRSEGKLERSLLLELADPALGARMSDLDSAEAILVLGEEPLHTAPILDLRIRKAVRRSGTRLLCATARPTTLDGGAAEAVRFAPGDAAAFVSALAGALGAKGYKAGGEYADAAKRVAAVLRDAPDTVIVWHERISHGPAGGAAVAALVESARALSHHDRYGSGLLEIPDGTNARGLREVGCVPTAGPGLSEVEPGISSSQIRAALAGGELEAVVLVNADPVRDHPDGGGWREALGEADFVVCVAMFESSSTAFADVVLPAESHAEKDGTVTHPDGRLQRLRPGIPHPGEVRMGWQWLCELLALLGDETGLQSGPEVLGALAEDVPFYVGITHEEIGGTGVRWQERPGSGAAAPRPDSKDRAPESASAPTHDGLLLGTYRDLWAGEAIDHSPALRFLVPSQRLELAPGDAERLGVSQGDRVTVSSNGSSVDAEVVVRERMREGAAFMIDGTAADNANLLADGAPRPVEVRRAE